MRSGRPLRSLLFAAPAKRSTGLLPFLPRPQEQAKAITKLRQEYELNSKEMQGKYEKKMKILRDDLELRRKQEIHEIEERKNTHINELMKKHEKAFSDIKGYYNDITHNNLDLIKTLKEDVAEMKKKEASNEKLMCVCPRGTHKRMLVHAGVPECLTHPGARGLFGPRSGLTTISALSPPPPPFLPPGTRLRRRTSGCRSRSPRR